MASCTPFLIVVPLSEIQFPETYAGGLAIEHALSNLGFVLITGRVGDCAASFVANGGTRRNRVVTSDTSDHVFLTSLCVLNTVIGNLTFS